MKALVYLLLFFPFSLFSQTQIVNVGATANDGTGDPIRTAFQKVNLNTLAVQDSLGNIYRETQVRNLINDTAEARMAAALELSNIAWMKTDTISGQVKQIVTQTQLSNFTGGGSGIGMYELRGIVGTTTGFPGNGDSIIINTGFVTHPRVQVLRDGSTQWHNRGLVNNSGTTEDVFVFNQATGTIITRPVFATGEKVIVYAFDPIVWNDLVPEGGAGGGGGGGASTLLTSLLSSWSLNETTGSVFADNTALDNDGGSIAAASSTAKFGYSRRYTVPNQYSSVAYDASLDLAGEDEFTVSLWIRLDTLPSVTGRNAYLYSSQRSDAEYWSNLLYINTSDQLRFYAKNSASVSYLTTSIVSAFSINTWYNIIAVVDGTGNNLKLIINGADAANATQAFSGTFLSFDNSRLTHNSLYELHLFDYLMISHICRLVHLAENGYPESLFLWYV